jgi:hypothetical protein
VGAGAGAELAGDLPGHGHRRQGLLAVPGNARELGRREVQLHGHRRSCQHQVEEDDERHSSSRHADVGVACWVWTEPTTVYMARGGALRWGLGGRKKRREGWRRKEEEEVRSVSPSR